MKGFVILLLGACFLSGSVEGTSEPKTCRYNLEIYGACECNAQDITSGDIVSCHGVTIEQMSEIFKNMKLNSRHINNLYLNNSDITVFPDAFFGAVGIKRLILHAPSLVSLSPQAFQGAREILRYLTITDSSLQEFPYDTVNHLELLRWLSLSSKNITALDSVRMANLTHVHRVTHLEIKNTMITSLENGTFSGFSRLSSFLFHNSPISEMPVGALPSHQIKRLELSGCNIKEIPLELLEQIKFYGILEASRCNITGISAKVSQYIASNNLIVGLNDNPLNCDCSMKEAVQILNSDPTKDYVHGACQSPSNLQGMAFNKLKAESFSC